MKKLFLILFLLVSSSSFAQEIPPISTDRPDQTESPDIVPLKYTQIEAGLSYERLRYDHINGVIYEIFTTPDVLVRYGLAKTVELRFGASVNTGKTTVNGLGNSTSTDFGPLMIGAKFNITEEGEILPKTSLLFEADMPALTIKSSDSYFNPAIKLCFSNELPTLGELSYNLGIDMDNGGNTTTSTFLYSISFGFDFTSRVGMFTEVYGFIPFESQSSRHYVDAGFTYLVNNNTQIDVSGGYDFQDNLTDYFIGAGISFRFPN
jgi:predicted porin